MAAMVVGAGGVRAQAPAADGVGAVGRCELALVDGSVLQVQSVAAEQADGPWRVELVTGATRRIDGDRVLTLHAAAADRADLAAVHLVGGDVVRGLVVGGDQGGNTLQVQSPSLGRLTVPVDRLECVVLQPGVASARQLVLPEGVDEALFQRARLGFDRVAGTVHQFGDGRIRFQSALGGEPRWFPAEEVVGLRLAGGFGRPQPATAELVTRAGDRVGVAFLGLRDDRLAVRLEDGSEVELGLDDVACLTFLDHGARFLSDLEPDEVRERAFDGEVLLPWRRDAAVTGGPLLVAGRTHARGLGVHSRSTLTFTAPEGTVGFWTRVAFDDAASRLPVRGAVDVEVRIGDEVVFRAGDLRAGEPPRSTGMLEVEPGQQVVLHVDFGAGRDLGDRVDWLSPVFVTGQR